MPTTTTSSGEIVVPMSSILDALEGVLSEAERQALFAELINLSPAGVAPGDLITAELFNNIMSDVNELMVRVAALEGGAGTAKPPIITRIEPFTVTAGNEMTVIGENLTPSLLTLIEIGDTRIATNRLKLGSGSTRLIFNAPTMIGLPPAGAPVTIEIANAAGQAEAAFVLRPGESETLQMIPVFRLMSVTPNQDIARTTTYTLAFEVDISSSHAETFTLVPTLAVTPATGWSVTVQGSNQITVPLSAGSPVTRAFTLQLQTGNNDGTGELSVALNANRFTGFSRQRNFPVAVGDPMAATDGPIQFGSASVLGDGSATRVVGGNIAITRTAAGGTGTIRLRMPVTIDEVGTYAVSAALDPPNPDWVITAAATPTTYNVTSAGQVLTNIAVTIDPQNGNPSNAQLKLSVTGAGALADAEYSIGLRAVDNFA
jgi:hypothetical protein